MEWKSPRPVGTPYGRLTTTAGTGRAALTPDIQGRHAQVIAAGSTPYGPPSPIPVGPAGATATAFGFPDPDGSTLEWIAASSPPERLSHQNANCRDLRKSFPFYQRVVGLDHNIRPFSPEPFDQTLGSLGRAIRNPDGTIYEGLVDFDAPFFSYRADSRNPIDLLQWEIPGVFGAPLPGAQPPGDHPARLRGGRHPRRLPRPEEGLERASRVPLEEWDLGEFGERKVVIFEDPDGDHARAHRARAVRDRDQPGHGHMRTGRGASLGAPRRPHAAAARDAPTRPARKPTIASRTAMGSSTKGQWPLVRHADHAARSGNASRWRSA